MARQHTKSRLGCNTCKQRKVKCDEAKPRCARCVTSDRTCSYLGTPCVPQPKAPSKPISRLSSSHHSPASISEPVSSFAGVSPSGPWNDAASVADYSLVHMELLMGFRDRLRAQMPNIYPDFEKTLDLAHTEAFRCAYLMDALVGLAAAQKSTLLDARDKNPYVTEATRMQTRAIQRFETAQREGTAKSTDGRVTAFLFSSLVNQHVLFDVFSLPGGLPDVLDRFIHCIYLHHGMRHTVFQSLDTINHLGHTIRWPETGKNPRGPECDGLLELVRSQGMDETTRETYLKAIDFLQWLFDEQRALVRGKMTGVHEWPVRVSLEYAELLRQRRPEALAVMAYYAVILHRADEYWPVAGCAKPFVSLISAYLGEYWADWLRWPLQAVEGDSWT
ncbi:hypothetical protein F5X68DRAFT_263002 [Plectosphaerella plurivora]|uniref:Zn(2)-C6 fungal-type domain-containing protein n=1 Tax=Plectosphaerella plurivora TaxID=936078 RepID=A0A9P8V9M1_9PEZI|nr:hypothetical protein F5X68DRAFT_263002 [Plectosphaerella plurivora]